MSDAIKALRDYLAKSPSVIYPEDVLVYLPAIEAENAKLGGGHTDAWVEASLEMKRLRDCLHAILSRGEAPAHVMSDE